ncbi:hypothetical protein BH11MYX1_BH11MYX1_06530 [soil metagenome]
MKLGYLMLSATAACGFAPQASSVDAREQPLDASSDDAHGDGPPPDGQKVFLDAPPALFELSMCPTSYTASLSSTMTVSRYRVTQSGTATTLEALCEADHPGWTHLIVLDVANEGYQMAHAIEPSVAFWAGAVQPKAQATPSTGWVWFSGDAIAATAWSSQQPNDNNDGVENNEQNFAYVDSFGGTMNDSAATYSFSGICECDGVAVPATVAAMIAQTP